MFGTDVMAPCETFEQLADVYQMDKRLLANVISAHYTTPTPIQMQAIPVMMNVSNSCNVLIVSRCDRLVYVTLLV